jgi:hypothetical protein
MKNIFTLLALLWAPVIFGQTSGGPDAYGYVWRDSDDPNGPTFNWVDITSVGTPVNGLTDDNASQFITMGGMVFHYYWTDVTKIIIGSNGWLGFSPASNIAHCFPTIPTPGGAADHFLAPFMTDLLISQPGFNVEVYYYYDQTNDRFIVSYINAPWWNVNSPGYVGSNTFQVILSAQDSSITYQYLDVDQVNLLDQPTCNQDLVIGIENLTGDIGLQVYQEVVPQDNYAIKFYYPNPVTYTIKDAGPQWNQNVENKGQFITAQTNTSLQTGINNFGNSDITSDIIVDGELTNLNNLTVYSSSGTIANLAAGAINTVVFPTPANLNPGQYYFQTTTTNAQDINGGNNTNVSELNAVDMSQGVFLLSYATQNFPTASVVWQGAGDGGAGVYLEPPTYPVYLDSVAVFIEDFGGAQNFRIEVYDDDLGSDIPGSVLSSQIVSGNTYVPGQWVTVPLSSPIELTSGGIFIGWIHNVGATIALGTEQNGPISRQSFEYIGGNWAVYRENDQTEFLINGYFTTSCGAFSVNTESVQHVTCYGGSDGAIDVTVTGGTQPYTFNWDNAVGAVEDPFGLGAGVYVLSVTDVEGCGTGATVTINENSQVVGNAVVTPSTQGSNGAIDLTASGGTPPYSFQWSNNSTSEDITGLSSGTYTVTITDAEGCTGSISVDVTDQVGINDLGQISISVYPNPNSGIFSVVGDFRSGHFEVMDVTGRIITFTCSPQSDRTEIRLQDAPDGMYMLRWVGEESVGSTFIILSK